MDNAISFGYVILLTALLTCEAFDLRIMHTNDVQARFEQFNKYGSTCSDDDASDGNCFGGVPRRVTKIDEIRDTYENTILLDGGDQFQGTQWYYYYKGRATAYFMNQMDYTAMALGSHEFDNGVDLLVDFIINATFPVLCCNIDATYEPQFESVIQKSVVLEVGGEKIGIIGYTSPLAPETSVTGRLIFLEEGPAIQEEVDKLTAEGINKIIALGHSGYAMDKTIAKSIVGIDIIVGGYSDTFLYTGNPPTDDVVIGPYPTTINPDGAPNDTVLIVQNIIFAKYLGFLDVTFDDDGKITAYSGNPIVLDDNVEQDPETLAEINQFKIPINEFIQRVIGETYVLLEGGSPRCRTHECTMGNVVTDAMLEAFVMYQSEEAWSDVAISIVNGGGIRTSVTQGVITFGDVTAVLPFEGTFDIFDIEGRYLLDALENSVYYYGDVYRWGRFLQMSGILVTYNVLLEPGRRVVSVEVRCTECAVPDYEPLDLEKTYRIITSSFIVGGGDGYTMLADNLKNLVRGNLDAGVVTTFIAKHSPIIHGREGRITFDNKEEGESGLDSEESGSSSEESDSDSGEQEESDSGESDSEESGPGESESDSRESESDSAESESDSAESESDSAESESDSTELESDSTESESDSTESASAESDSADSESDSAESDSSGSDSSDSDSADSEDSDSTESESDLSESDSSGSDSEDSEDSDSADSEDSDSAESESDSPESDSSDSAVSESDSAESESDSAESESDSDSTESDSTESESDSDSTESDSTESESADSESDSADSELDSADSESDSAESESDSEDSESESDSDSESESDSNSSESDSDSSESDSSESDSSESESDSSESESESDSEDSDSTESDSTESESADSESDSESDSGESESDSSESDSSESESDSEDSDSTESESDSTESESESADSESDSAESESDSAESDSAESESDSELNSVESESDSDSESDSESEDSESKDSGENGKQENGGLFNVPGKLFG